MINIDKNKNCCGCWACVQKCPKQCISMNEDAEGFLYPKVNIEICINCELCEKVCPVINQRERGVKPLFSYAAYNKDDEIRSQSSSGGITNIIAEYIIKHDGVVFGAIFNDKWEVEHACIRTEENLVKLRGSKYVQSRIGDTYKQVELELKKGTTVLFIGTPCQISGLYLFLHKLYDNLITVDFICHGVPSPGVWRDYLRDVANTNSTVVGNCSLPSSLNLVSLINRISFRDKSCGWKEFRFVIEFTRDSTVGKHSSYYSTINQGRYENEYMGSFLRDYNLRPSCYECPAKAGKSGSDITVCDFWCVENEIEILSDDKGVSGVILNTEKGASVFKSINDKIEQYNVTLSQIVENNKSYYKSCKAPIYRKYFFRKVKSKRYCISKCLKPTISEEIIMTVEKCYNKISELCKLQ